jgi:hypothetical protein
MMATPPPHIHTDYHQMLTCGTACTYVFPSLATDLHLDLTSYPPYCCINVATAVVVSLVVVIGVAAAVAMA